MFTAENLSLMNDVFLENTASGPFFSTGGGAIFNNAWGAPRSRQRHIFWKYDLG